MNDPPQRPELISRKTPGTRQPCTPTPSTYQPRLVISSDAVAVLILCHLASHASCSHMFLTAILSDFYTFLPIFLPVCLWIGHSKVSLQQERCCLCNVDMNQQCLAQAHFIISTVGRHRWVLTCEPVQQWHYPAEVK